MHDEATRHGAHSGFLPDSCFLQGYLGTDNPVFYCISLLGCRIELAMGISKTGVEKDR